MTGQHRRIRREKKTLQAMLSLFCRHHHSSNDCLCKQCQVLHDYAMQRLDRCVFGKDKPTCGKCPIHCYKKDMREKVINVMRYSGPKMIFHHPIFAIAHILDGLKSTPKKHP